MFGCLCSQHQRRDECMHRALTGGRAHLGLVGQPARMQQASTRSWGCRTGNLQRSWSKRAYYSALGCPWLDLPRMLHGLCWLQTSVDVRYVRFASQPGHTRLVRRVLQWHGDCGCRAESANDKIQMDAGGILLPMFLRQPDPAAGEKPI